MINREEKYSYILRLRISKFKCEDCGITIEDYWKKFHRTLLIHHVDENHSNNDINNVKILCQRCHNRIHKPFGGWNKGLTKYTDKRILKMSISMSKRQLTKEHKLKIGTAMKGRILTPEWKQKISETRKKLFSKN